MARPHVPRTHQVFWCNDCDAVQVDSHKPETGKFYLQWGHMYQKLAEPIGEFDGDYVGVMFALCPACDKKS